MVYYSTMKFLKHRLTKDVALVFAGNIFCAFLGFLALLMISRTLSVAEFGLFNIAITFLTLASLFTSFGMDTSLTHFISLYSGRGKSAEAALFAKTALVFRALTAAMGAIFIFIFAPLIAHHLLKAHKLIYLLRLVALGIFFASLLNSLKPVLYGYRRFRDFIIMQLSVDVVKVLLAVSLLWLYLLTPFTSILVFSLAPCIGIAVGLRMVRDIFKAKGSTIKKVIFELLSYSKWIYASTLCSQLFNYIGIFMLTRISGVQSAGIYGLALNLTYIFPIVSTSLKSVLLPEVSRFTSVKQFESYIANSLKISLLISLPLLSLLIFSRYVIPFLFGQRYFASVTDFNWLLLGYVASIIAGNVQMPLYTLNKPHVLAAVSLFQMIAMFIGCFLLISRIGVHAPAILVCFINIAALLFLVIYTSYQVHKMRKAVKVSTLPEELLS